VKVWSFFSGVCLALSATLFAQEALSNASIEKMAKAGLGDVVIVSMIQSQAGYYDVTPDSLIALKREGISDKVLAAMATKGAALTPPQPAVAADSYEDFDIGVYRRARNTWIPVATEQVNWKTGGVLKSIATDGIVKGDVNGRLTGGGSATQLNTPLEFLIRTPDGVDATDFQLVHLHEKSDAREFRTMTGGVFHRSGGASRDGVTFGQTRIAKHTYKVTLSPNLPRGEYAFLANQFFCERLDRQGIYLSPRGVIKPEKRRHFLGHGGRGRLFAWVDSPK
jgi:hypothetical protein